METYLLIFKHIFKGAVQTELCADRAPLFGADDIVGRYDNLSRSVSERNEKLQITLTRSLSVQDGLDEMLDWMGSVESSLVKQGQVPLNSTALQDLISKSIVSDPFQRKDCHLQLKTRY